MNQFPFKLPLILDGGTGTHLIAAGMPEGVCVEQWILDNPEVITKLQQAYAAAGSNAVYAPTFGANRARLASFGFEDRVAEMNKALVALTRAAVGEDVLVGGDLSPTGLFIEPYGEAGFDEIVEIYREQIAALAEAGVDFIGLETMMSLWECRAGLIAAKDFDLPVFVTITVDGSGRTLMGATLPACVAALQSLGACAVGINCSEGPEGLEEAFNQAAACAQIPLIAKPNAGRPDPNDPEKFDLTVEQFAEKMAVLIDSGAEIIGGCCGTGPAHIAAIAPLAAEFVSTHAEADCCANENCVFFLPEEPSGLELSDALTCSYSLEDDLIDLDDDRVNVAVVRVDTEEEAQILSEAANMSRLPISILSDNAAVLERALRLFHGRAIVDSHSELEPEVIEEIAARYGALVY